jgi:uncharacterized protein (TIGR01619 family)
MTTMACVCLAREDGRFPRGDSTSPNRGLMSQDWDVYLTNVNHRLASVRFDLGIRPAVPDLSRPWLLWVWVHFKQPRPDGLSSDEEFDRLSSLENALEPAIEKTADAVFVGCITTEGRREFYFYGKTAEGLKETANQVAGVFHGYRYWCDAKQDPGWTQYLEVLYPSDEQLELITNRRLMDLMEKRGDRLASARDVTHWSTFKSVAGRETFRNAVQLLGYRVVSEYRAGEPSNGYPYGICIVRKQEMARRAVDAAVIELFRASKAADGDYTGWECELIVDPASQPSN